MTTIVNLEIPDFTASFESSKKLAKNGAYWSTERLKFRLKDYNVPSHGTRQEMYDRLLGATLYYEEQRGIRNLEEEDAHTTATQEQEQTEDESQEKNWVGCEKCGKWRSLPAGMDATSLPDAWYCEMNTWNDLNHCDKAEEEGANDEEDEEQNADDEGEGEDEEVEYYEDLAVLRRLLEDFKLFRDEVIATKKRRKEEKALQEEERKRAKVERLSNKVQEAIDISPDQKEANYKSAKKKSSTGQFPMHKYCEQFSESTALFKTLVDIALLQEYNEDLQKYVNHSDKYGRTPLHYAVISQCYDVEKALMEVGANPYICDMYEKSAEEYGMFRGMFPKQKKTYLDDII